ncbi:MAG: HD domain-containing protein [Fusobacteria bacterium]|nr:HD domain-containing protein [Fusobacteriota bacterium]
MLENEYSIEKYLKIEQPFQEKTLNSFECICLDIDTFKHIVEKKENSHKIMRALQTHSIPLIVFSKERSRDLESEMLRSGAFDFITFPINLKCAIARIDKSIQYREHEMLLKEIAKIRSYEVERLQINFVRLLNLVEENKGSETMSHLKRLQNYCVIIGKSLRKEKRYRKIISDRFFKYIYALAPMHDIGTVTLPESIVLKYASGNINSTEYEVYKNHARKGGEIIDQISEGIEDNFFLDIAYELAQSHQEYWTGVGYPDVLVGDEIPLSAQLLRISEDYNVMVQKDAYRSHNNNRITKTHKEAVDYIISQKNILYSPELVEAFLSVEEVIEKIT